MPVDRSKTMQRVGPLSGLPELMAELGGDPDRLLRVQGLGPGDLDPDRQIPFGTAIALITNATAETNCEEFGLLLGARHDHRILGPVGRLMATAPTLGAALMAFVSWQFGNSRGASAYMHRVGEGVIVGYGIYERESAGSMQVYDLAIAVGCNFIRSLTNGRVKSREVHLTRRIPANPRLYERVLGAPVRFDQHHSGLVLAEKDLATPLDTADRSENQTIGTELREVYKGGVDLVGRLKHVLRPKILLGHAGMPEMARLLQLHPRTLRRQLAKLETTFEAVKADVQFAVACEFLELTNLPVGEVATALSFGNHSSFDRAFRRWSGMTPSEWRDGRRV